MLKRMEFLFEKVYNHFSLVSSFLEMSIFVLTFLKSKFARLGIDILFSCFFTKEKHKLSPSLPAMNSGCVCGQPGRSRVARIVQGCHRVDKSGPVWQGWSRVGRGGQGWPSVG